MPLIVSTSLCLILSELLITLMYVDVFVLQEYKYRLDLSRLPTTHGAVSNPDPSAVS